MISVSTPSTRQRTETCSCPGSVDAAADGDLLLSRFDVDVAGSKLDGLGEDVVDQTDDAGLSSHSAQGVFVLLLTALLFLIEILEFAEHTLKEGTAHEAGSDFTVPGLFRQVSDGIQIVGVADQHSDILISPLNGQTAVGVEKFGRGVFRQLRKHYLLFDQQFNSVSLRVDLRQLCVGQPAEAHQFAVALFGIGKVVGTLFRKSRFEDLLKFRRTGTEIYRFEVAHFQNSHSVIRPRCLVWSPSPSAMLSLKSLIAWMASL